MNKRCKYFLVSFLFILLLAGCGPKPEEVALQLAEAVNTQDVEQALALFAEDAVVTSVSPEPFRGKAQIQGWLEGMIADDFKLEAEIAEVSGNKVVEHDTMTMDSMSFFGIEPLTGTSELVVEDGVIQTINFSFSEKTLADMQSAPFVAQEDLIGTWYVGSFMELRDDGTCRVADNQADLSEPVSEAHPGSQEAWTYDGMVMTMQALEPGEGEGYTCTPDEVGVYFVRWAGDELDRLKFEPIDDPCGSRMGGMMWGHWKPVESQDSMAAQEAAPDSLAPEEVVAALGETLNAGDLDGAMALIAEDMIFDIAGEEMRGADNVQGLFEELIAGNFRIQYDVQAIDGNTVTTETQTWGEGIPQGAEPNVATETYAIKDGRIASISWMPTEETVARLTAVSAVHELGAAINNGDVAGAMAFIADDILFDSAGELHEGAAEVQSLFEDLIAGDFRIEQEVTEFDGLTVTSNTTTWGAGIPPEIEPLEAVEKYVVEEGKITGITWTPTEESAAKLSSAMEAAQE